MATVPMTKIGIIGYGSDGKKIVEFLQKESVVELVPLEEPEGSSIELEQTIRRLDNCASFLISFCKNPPKKPILSPEKARSLIAEQNVDEMLSTIENLRSKYEKLKSEIAKNRGYIQILEPWRNLDSPLSSMKDTANVKIRMGTIPPQFVEIFEHEVIEQKLLFWREISRGHDGMHIVIAYHNTISQWLDELLAKVEFTHWEPKLFSDTPQREIAALKDKISSAKAELQKITAQAEDLSDKIPVLWATADHYEQLLEQYTARASSMKTERTFAMQGWIPQKLFPRLKKRLETTFDAIEVMKLPVLPEDEPPVALKNPFFVEAFEIITDLYGRPKKGMVDPTPYVAPFFAIYFALCLTDAGYGLLITIIGALGLFLMKQPAAQKFFRMILYVGILTIGAGIITGGYFGIAMPEPSQATGLAKFALSLKLFDPLRDIMTFFAISIALGIIQLSVGFLLSGYVQLQASKSFLQKLHAVFISLSWTATTVGVGFFVMYYVIPEKLASLGPLGVTILKFGAAGIVIGHLIIGKLAGKSLGESIGNAFGFDGLYGIISVFSDLLSFVRITALGLSTGIVAGVITNMTIQMKGALFAAGIIILIGGHIFYCLFSALGAFVHPTRLQFVEFFSKFYESGGKAFEPFRRKYRRIEVI